MADNDLNLQCPMGKGGLNFAGTYHRSAGLNRNATRSERASGVNDADPWCQCGHRRSQHTPAATAA